MRYRFSVSMLLVLFVVLSMMDALAAPAPYPIGILDIGPPPKEKTAEQHLRDQIVLKTDLDTLNTVCSYPEVMRLPAVASLEDARLWLAKNLRFSPADGDRLLRITFRAGKRDEQVTIINAFLRASLYWHDIGGRTLKWGEECLRMAEDNILELEKRIESGQHPHMVDSYREGINWLRYTRIPEIRAEIARRKQYAVIKWAK